MAPITQAHLQQPLTPSRMPAAAQAPFRPPLASLVPIPPPRPPHILLRTKPTPSTLSTSPSALPHQYTASPRRSSSRRPLCLPRRCHLPHPHLHVVPPCHGWLKMTTVSSSMKDRSALSTMRCLQLGGSAGYGEEARGNKDNSHARGWRQRQARYRCAPLPFSGYSHRVIVPLCHLRTVSVPSCRPTCPILRPGSARLCPGVRAVPV